LVRCAIVENASSTALEAAQPIATAEECSRPAAACAASAEILLGH
jgi:hypothetical protein